MEPCSIEHTNPADLRSGCRAVLHLRMRDAWDELSAAAADPSTDDARVAALTRQLVAMQKQGLEMHRNAP